MHPPAPKDYRPVLFPATALLTAHTNQSCKDDSDLPKIDSDAVAPTLNNPAHRTECERPVGALNLDAHGPLIVGSRSKSARLQEGASAYQGKEMMRIIEEWVQHIRGVPKAAISDWVNLLPSYLKSASQNPQAKINGLSQLCAVALLD